MPRPANPFVMHTLLGFVCLIAVLLLLPDGTALWRKVMAGMFSIALGYQIATAMQTGPQGRVAATKAGLECLTFPMMIMAMLKLPETRGWLLLGMGLLWRPLIGKLWK